MGTNGSGPTAPAGMPKPVVDLPNAEISRVLTRPEIRDARNNAAMESDPDA